MDWTGGTRRRFAAGKHNTILQKQKAHFAKARAALHATRGRSLRSQKAIPQAYSLASRIDGNEHLPESQAVSRSQMTERRGPARVEPSMMTGNTHQTDRDLEFPRNLHETFPWQTLETQSRPRSAASQLKWKIQNEDRSPRDVQSSVFFTPTDEERLLLARRRNLLARPSWLGLSLFHSSRVSASSSREKHLVGRRRKVRKLPGAREGGQPGRALTSVRLPLAHQVDASGSFNGDDVQVKIGTDAMATQTQQSGPSQCSRQTSMRHISTDVTLLSEESMLLDNANEVFELKTARITRSHESNIIAPCPDDDILSLRNGSGLWQQRVPDCALMVECELRNQSFDPEVVKSDQGQSTSYSRSMVEALPLRSSGPEDWAGVHDEGHNASLVADAIGPRIVTSNIAKDEDLWRQFININPSISSHGSVVALNSSSSLEGDSERPRWRSPSILDNFDRGQSVAVIISTPKGAGTQASFLKGPRDYAKEEKAILSPSASLRRITMLAQQDPPPKPPDDNELWRAFVVGSSSHSSIFSRLNTTTDIQPSLGDAASPYGATISAFVSSLGTSRFSSPSEQINDIADIKYPQVPIIETVEHDALPAAKPLGNIHARTMATSQSRLSAKEKEPLTRKPFAKQEKAGRTSYDARGLKWQRQGIQSIYDLVDSDGYSMA